MRFAYGALPTVEFMRDAWPTLLESWLRTVDDHREQVLQALQGVRGEKGTVRGSRAQMTYLRRLRNSKTLRGVAWSELIAAGEEERQGAPQAVLLIAAATGFAGLFLAQLRVDPLVAM